MEVVGMKWLVLRHPLIWPWETKINESLYHNENDDQDSRRTVGRCSLRVNLESVKKSSVFITYLFILFCNFARNTSESVSQMCLEKSLLLEILQNFDVHTLEEGTCPVCSFTETGL